MAAILNKPGSRANTIACVQDEVERIYELAQTLQVAKLLF